jgi:A/G-specific adenine glycosylase
MAAAKPNPRRAATEALLRWYAPRAVAYAWRWTRDPYAVWVSEVMLQQTQASRVEPAYVAFLERFPDVGSLASAPQADVVRAWGRLGYPSRAVRLHRAAREIVARFGGVVPTDATDLRSLPGVGPYTASAIASIAGGRRVAALDTNARRIVARLAFGAEPDVVPSGGLAAEALAWVPVRRAPAWNQALMDLGREVCRPRHPRCAVCPLARWCRFAAAGAAGRSSAPRQPPYEGSVRQARGRILALLRERPSLPVRDLGARIGVPAARADEALAGLTRDGLVVVARGRARLA